MAQQYQDPHINVRPSAKGPGIPYYGYDVALEDIPRVQAANIGVAKEVQAPGQDWSSRYGADYNAALGANAATQQQRQHMQDVAAGRAGPSLAELQLRQGQETASANAMGAALTGRGGTGSQIAAMRAGNQASLATNQAAAQQRAAEQMAAEQQVGSLLGQEQAGAAGLGSLTASQAGLEQGWQGQSIQAQQANQQNMYQTSLANQQAQLAAQQANQGAYTTGLGYEVGSFDAAQQANAEAEAARLEAVTAKRQQDVEMGGIAMNTVGSIVGAGAMMSDERSKRRIEELDAENADLRRALAGAATGDGPKVDAMREARPTEFEYRDEAYGAGFQPAAAPGERMVGVMAQDVARGGDPGMVREDPYSGSLGVDTGKLASAAAAGSATALDRQDELEARLATLEDERTFKERFLAQEQAAFNDRYNAYMNAEQWSGTTPTPSQRPAPWLQRYMGGAR